MAHLLDITRDVCPMTKVKVGMALARLGPEDTLEVRLREAELRNVATSLKADGWRIASARLLEDGYLLTVQRADAADPPCSGTVA